MNHVQKPEKFKDLGHFDVSEIAKRLGLLSDVAWAREDEVKPNKFDCFKGNTKHIILKFPDNHEDVRSFYETPGWRIWQPVLQPMMDQIAQEYGYKTPIYSKAMFARLEAGKSIAAHIDQAEINHQCHKIHVPIYTNPEVRFFIEDQGFHFGLGHAHEVNNVVPHWVSNEGDEDRIHFIFELYEG